MDPAAHRPVSPPSSGRSTPVPRAPRRPIEDAIYKKDKNYRRYAAGVERALALFDTPQQEWADYISFLGRLLKALQPHPSEIPAIPHSATIATRLAQCLNPQLPSGVHQKALEVYSYIFSIIGKNGLNRDLTLYFPGLSIVLSFANLTVRPVFLSLFENHILTLDAHALRPALKALIMSILPGLEEETSEDFERMVQVLDRLRDAVCVGSNDAGDFKGDTGDSLFWQCLFLATITNPSRRQGALAFLTRRLPKFESFSGRRPSIQSDTTTTSASLGSEAEIAISPEPGLLIRCFSAGLCDTQLLIQRGFLDLLVTHLPLDSPVLQERVRKPDLDRLVSAAAGVVNRRDMSLNRRLWAWFLGPEPQGGATAETPVAVTPNDAPNSAMDPSTVHAEYFARFGLEALSRSILSILKRDYGTASERAKAFRICLSLMDRWEVGGLLVPEVFVPALESVKTYSDTATKEELEELMRSANVFFDGVESGLIWGKLTVLVAEGLQSTSLTPEAKLHRLELAKFTLSRFNTREEEMLIHHMPLMAIELMILLQKYLNRNESRGNDSKIAQVAFNVVELLTQLIPERAYQPTGEHGNQITKNDVNTSTDDIVTAIDAFYLESHGNLDLSEPPMKPDMLGFVSLREAGQLFSLALEKKYPSGFIESCGKILSTLVLKVKDIKALEHVDLVSVFRDTLYNDRGIESGPVLPFQCLVAILSVVTSLQADSVSENIAEEQLPDLVFSLTALLWRYLSPGNPKYHVEAVRSIWQLHSLCPTTKLVEAAITTLISKGIDQLDKDHTLKPAETGRRFAILWTHTMHEQHIQSEKSSRGAVRRVSTIPGLVDLSMSDGGGYQAVLTRPLLILLDSQSQDGTEMCAFIRGWLQDLHSLNRVFDVITSHLRPLDTLRYRHLVESGATQPSTIIDDSKLCLYYLGHVLHILNFASNNAWATLLDERVMPLDAHSPDEEKIPLQNLLIQICIRALDVPNSPRHESHIEEIHRTAALILRRILSGPFAPALKDMELEAPLMTRLNISVPLLQSILLDTVLLALKIRLYEMPPPLPPRRDQRRQSRDIPLSASRVSLTSDRQGDDLTPMSPAPPPQLIQCLRKGFSSSSSRLILDDWVRFLIEVLPVFTDTIFQNLVPLVETICREIKQVFSQLKKIFKDPIIGHEVSPESTLISLINGLEQILARAHDKLTVEEAKAPSIKSPEQPQGFFENMVSGLYATTANQNQSTTSNSRLAVLLCFQDTVRICFTIWSWGGYRSSDDPQDPTSLATFGYTSLRMRNRSRRILEHLFTAETLECLETLAVIWCSSQKDADSVLGLLNVLNGSKPKNTMPAIFNAIYSRTNPSALEPSRKSTLTSDLSETELVSFLIEYTRSLEDDAMDEIWPDCMTFLRDVLANPLPHRHILPSLLECAAVLGEKADNTNFGEQKKMRRELGEVFNRLLTAIFTTRGGFPQDPSQVLSPDKATDISPNKRPGRSADTVSVLALVVPKLSVILIDNDRVVAAVTNISTNIIGPAFRAKNFPENISPVFFDLVYQTAKVAHSNKSWKKDVSEMFNDPRFIYLSIPLVKEYVLPILNQWTLNDKDRMSELLSRLFAPTTAGIMFGVGAASARLEADRRTQLNLRRISILILSSPTDTYVPSIPTIAEKVVELLTATNASSPSSATRPEVFMLLRAILLKTTHDQLAPLWPIMVSELQSAISSAIPDADNQDKYTNSSLIQACKLLDVLLTVAPDDFQPLEWLFITDTIDAEFRPANFTPVALADDVAEALAAAADASTPQMLHQSHHVHTTSVTSLPGISGSAGDVAPKRRPFLDSLISIVQADEGEAGDVRAMARHELATRVIRPFLGQLSIGIFEETYAMGVVDWDACLDGLVKDLFDEGGIVS